ncbi:hypothetical protein BOTBODRAFT_149136 [Botryobasidium botryosum FD-172 SS1]|uniref:F-box domain-containing protein n=1 Tax=Botryobasidium botryosum (strain FD-172 SS1) TaxID=930990 RepID=A0A067LW68_BOTB1|nr:hypothetical protein BOTBODRAFT_149136 [Botryobasidium botryosum FD-172 SS1]
MDPVASTSLVSAHPSLAPAAKLSTPAPSQTKMAFVADDADADTKAIHWLAASSGYLVDILVTPGDTQYTFIPDAHPITELSLSLQQASIRWRTLCLTTSVEDAMSLFLSGGLTFVPNLRELSLKFVPVAAPLFASSEYAIPVNFVPATNSVVVDLALRTHWVAFPVPFAAAITSLTFNLLPEHLLGDLLSLLEPCSNLKRLVLKACRTDPSDIFGHPASPSFLHRTIHLPCLSTIVLDNVFHFDYLDTLNFKDSLQEFVATGFVWSASTFTALVEVLLRCHSLLVVVLRGQSAKTPAALPVQPESITLRCASLDVEVAPASEDFFERFHLPMAQNLRLVGLSLRAASRILMSAPRVRRAEFDLPLTWSKKPGANSQALIHPAITTLTARLMGSVHGVAEWQFPALQHLSILIKNANLRMLPKIGPPLLAVLNGNGTQLKTLHLDAVDVFDPAFASCLERLTELKELTLVDCHMTKKVLEQMGKPQALPVLCYIHLVLRNARDVSAVDLVRLFQSRRQNRTPKLLGVVHFRDSRGVAQKDVEVLSKVNRIQS